MTASLYATADHNTLQFSLQGLRPPPPTLGWFRLNKAWDLGLYKSLLAYAAGMAYEDIYAEA
jgi:hypothetical protein